MAKNEQKKIFFEQQDINTKINSHEVASIG